VPIGGLTPAGAEGELFDTVGVSWGWEMSDMVKVLEDWETLQNA
jgi:hypothetical protein